MVQRIFVGDVQGCADELDDLIDRIHAEVGGDFELLLTGDLVNRGPESFRVLSRVRALQDAGRARTVVGNHDLRLITVALGAASPGTQDTFGDVLAQPDLPDWVDWLRCQPLLIEGVLGGARFALVHAALAPEWRLEDAMRVSAAASAPLADANRNAARAFVRAAHAARRARMRREPPARAELPDERAGPALDAALDALGRLVSARSATPGGGWSERLPEEVPGGEPWHAAWTRAGHAFGVVYGHWALQRLHVAAGLRGLDTGCVHHGRGGDGFLTAWLPDERASAPFAVPDARFWHVLARRRYWT